MLVALLRVLAVSTCLTLTAAGAAWAHSTVSPEEVPAGSSETFTVTVPGEKEDVAIVEERVDVPQGFEVTDVSSPSGWQSEVEGGSVVWSGGEINLDKEQEFTSRPGPRKSPGSTPSGCSTPTRTAACQGGPARRTPITRGR